MRRTFATHKWLWIGVGVVAFLIVLAVVRHPGNPGTPTPPGAVQGPKPPAGVTFDTRPGPAGDIVDAGFKIGESLTSGLMKDNARITTVDILKYAQQAYPNLAEVDVSAAADIQDVYGRSSVDLVASLTYSRATLDKIDK